MQEEILIPITMFLAIGVVLYHYVKTRHTERMAIIEKGLNDEQLRYFKTRKRGIDSGWSIKLGSVLIGVGLAVVIGAMVPYDIQDSITVGLIFMLPGIGLLLVYKLAFDDRDNQE